MTSLSILGELISGEGSQTHARQQSRLTTAGLYINYGGATFLKRGCVNLKLILNTILTHPLHLGLALAKRKRANSRAKAYFIMLSLKDTGAPPFVVRPLPSTMDRWKDGLFLSHTHNYGRGEGRTDGGSGGYLLPVTECGCSTGE
ncbi:hypothetical protein EVAR_74575_1 [Eumeta japonica]|uniref:Uncharacterized protein n=1 Tax=Eumeta variegata TaxID=151549 RepID=A0A4C1TBR6_EUMVA|nr:hypothetical protein EVAR_74575_1 [Eumeta japonica]